MRQRATYSVITYARSSYARGNIWTASRSVATPNLLHAVYSARQALLLYQTTNQEAFAVVIDRNGEIRWQGRHYKGDLCIGPTTSRGLERLVARRFSGGRRW